ncbi:uroporphyrinogen-III synthase, partial [Ilumatobacter nonamiensis]|uniref:uroporphyrinogen-III synthase n=1 Tax=Ilumatobacter nonamiensis TaxID=467093 RepID=UPI0019D3FACA
MVVTREQRGELGRLLDEAGASVVHVPLIEVLDADPADLEAGWASGPDWVVVTSAAGADRVGAEAARRPGVRLAAVGTATAGRLGDLSGRPVDLVPARQLAEILVEEFNR